MDTYAKECLDAHNEYRRKHGSPPLVLSPWLMGVAQDWANNNASRGMMYHSNHPNDCENIFATGGGAVSGREPADCFYSEIKHYRFGEMGFTMQTGHFTQMVWKSTTMMGVGKATGRNGWTYVVVSYSPRGNVQGQFGSNVLPLGTPLPAGSTPRAASVAPAAAASTPRPSALIARTRTTRRANLSPDCSSDTSNQSSTTAAVAKKKNSTEKKERPKALPAKLDTSLNNPTPAMLAILARMRSKVAKKKNSTEKKERPKALPAKLDTSLNNPTPAMLAILARMRSKEETPSPAMPSKRKQARFE